MGGTKTSIPELFLVQKSEKQLIISSCWFPRSYGDQKREEVKKSCVSQRESQERRRDGAVSGTEEAWFSLHLEEGDGH